MRCPLIVETVARLRPRSCIIDGEAVVCDGRGMVSFDHIRYRRHDSSAFLFAFDLIELNGDDLGRDPLEVRKRPSRTSWEGLATASGSTTTSRKTMRPYSGTPASWDSKAL
jgi:ATP-dependent DNA ligase